MNSHQNLNHYPTNDRELKSTKPKTSKDWIISIVMWIILFIAFIIVIVLWATGIIFASDQSNKNSLEQSDKKEIGDSTQDTKITFFGAFGMGLRF